MDLKEKIEQDIIEAMKTKDEAMLSVLRLLKSAIHNLEIQKQLQLKNDDVSSVIQGQIKQRNDSIDMYEKGNRPELAAKEKAEIEILKKYLPQQMGKSEIRAIVTKAIADANASGIQDMGKVMGQIMPAVKGKADGSLVSSIAKEELSK